MIKLDIGGRPRLPRPGFEISKRVVALGLLILLMLIPLSMIGGLVSERHARRLSVESDIAGQWGYNQSIGGPLLIVPYIVHSQTRRSDGSIVEQEQRKLAYFLPDQLAIDAAIESQKRYRSIYEVLVYSAEIKLTGRLTPAAFAEWGVAAGDILWNEASIAVGIGDTSGIRALSFTLDGRPVTLTPGLARQQLLGSGLQARLPDFGQRAPGGPHQFALTLTLNGSGRLEFLPFGSETTLHMAADWPHPNFTGAALPAGREIGAEGFTADWTMSYLARAYPPAWRAEDLSFNDLADGRVGVELVLPGDSYQQTDRIIKYGVLVIGLTFATIFVVGLLRQARAHMVQYLLVGASICLFYLLLLSLSEHIRFGAAYAVASAADVATVSAYVMRTIHRLAGLVVAGMLGLVHGWMYLLLQMEDYVLLSGTIGLFVALLAVMYATRNIDWFRIGATSTDRTPEPPAATAMA